MHHFTDFKAFAKELYPRVGGVRFNQLKTIEGMLQEIGKNPKWFATLSGS